MAAVAWASARSPIAACAADGESLPFAGAAGGGEIGHGRSGFAFAGGGSLSEGEGFGRARLIAGPKLGLGDGGDAFDAEVPIGDGLVDFEGGGDVVEFCENFGLVPAGEVEEKIVLA